MKKLSDLIPPVPASLPIPRPFPQPVVDVERPHPTVSDSFEGDDTGAVLQVRLGGDIWSDFIRIAPEKRDPDALPRRDGGVPLFDDMTGIRQWE